MIAKEALGQDVITTRGRILRERALAAWRGNPAIQVMAPDAPADSLPILSFRIRDGRGGLVHHQLFTRMLSDIHGVQARGGCACAGSYAHRLLGIDRVQSEALSARIAQGEDIQKPGWVRLNFSVLLDDAKADRIIAAVDDLARNAARWAGLYQVDPATSRFTLRPDAALARIA